MHVGKYYPPHPGGIERFMADLLVSMAARGIDGFALVHHHAPRWEIQRPTGTQRVTVVRVPSLGQCLYAPVSPEFPLALKKILSGFDPHLIHLHLPNVSAFWALTLAQARRVPWVIHWHSDVVAPEGETWLMGFYRFYRIAETAMLQKAAAVIASSPPYLETSKPLAPWRKKSHVVPLGVDPARLPTPDPSRLRQAQSLWGRGEALRVLAVGRLSPYKGFHHLVAAAAQVPFVRLLIVGVGPELRRLHSAVKAWEVESRVGLLGYRSDSDVQALMATCDILCLPSTQRTEAFGLVLLEGMRYEKPALATRIPGSGVTWVVQDQRTGWLVPCGSADALAETMRHIGLDRNSLQTMGRAARLRFDAAFHIDKITDRLLALYNTLLAISDSST